MRWFIILAAVAVVAHGRTAVRKSRQINTGYGAPAETLYGAPSEETLDIRSGEESLPSYADEGLASYNDLSAEASSLDARSEEAGGDPLDMLMKSVPGIPGEDYPIFAEAPETAFSCEGQVNGGYYADSEAQCQVFHICSADGQGGLSKYSFLCPNGTIFNQQYFICDWWFNVDCSAAEALAESRNAELQAERESADARLAEARDLDAAGSAPAEYGAPVVEARAAEPAGLYGAPSEAVEERQPAYGGN